MPTQTITIKLAVPLDHLPGDYAQIHANGGSGDIDYDTPFSAKKIPLFPGGSGNYGFGYGPFGQVPFGGPWQNNVHCGFGRQPFGASPFGVGTVVITEHVPITECGTWTFALVCYDRLDNLNQPTPAESTVSVHVAPAKASGLQKESYNKDTDVLVLSVIDSAGQGRNSRFPSRLLDLTGSPFEGMESLIYDGSSSWTDPDLPSRNA